jgi:Flp pilus assembly protein TadG
MTTKSFIEKLLNRLTTFRTAQGGNVLITFALASIPVIGAVGAAVDYSRANSARTSMQAAMDAAGLILSKDNPQTMTDAERLQKATQYFYANFKRSDVNGVTITPVLTQPSDGSFRLDLTGNGSVPTVFARLIGTEQIPLQVTAQVVWGMKKLELALALDNTGSMSKNSKMVELKKAANSLLDTLEKAAGKAGDVKISIIPFAVDVKIGTGYKDTAWVDWTNYGTCGGKNKSKYDYDKAACESHSGTWNAGNKNNWNGCVMDRDQPNDTLDTVPSSTATNFPARQCNDSSLVSMLPLTDVKTDVQSLRDKITAMTPSGNTNVTIGLEWGWHSLTANDPLTQASDPKPDLDKVMILLTDGDNTENRWSNDQATIDARTSAACANAKDPQIGNIKIYTVRVIDGNATLLRNCATKPSMYYEVSSASQLNAVFTAIAQNLANLRIAK